MNNWIEIVMVSFLPKFVARNQAVWIAAAVALQAANPTAVLAAAIGSRADIQKALNAAHKAAAGVVDVNPGVYDIDSTLSIWSDTKLRAAGPGVRFRWTGRHTANILQNKNFTGTPDSNIVIEGITFENATLNSIRFTNVKKGSILDCNFLGAASEAIAIYGNGAGPGVNRDIEISGGWIGPTVDSGIDVQDVNGLRIMGVQFRKIGQASVNLEPNAATDAVIAVAGDSLIIAGGNSPFGIVVQGDHFGYHGSIRDVSFSGSTIDSTQTAVFFGGPNLADVTFSGVTVTRASRWAFRAPSAGVTRGVSVIGCSINYCSPAIPGRR